MSDQQSEANPLFFHGILMFVLSLAVILTLGVFGDHGIIAAVKAGKEGGTPTASKPVGANTLRDIDSANRRAQSDATQLTRKPTSLTDVAYKAESAKRLLGSAKGVLKFIVPIIMILIGASLGFVGFMLIKQKNWARHVGFAMVAIVLLYYTWLVAAGVSATVVDETGAEALVQFQWWKPAVLVIIAGIAGKFLWDLNQEKFAAPEPVAA